MSEKDSPQWLDEIIAQLSNENSMHGLFHERCDGTPMPSLSVIAEVVSLCRAILFPGFYGSSDITHENLSYYMGVNIEQLKLLLTPQVKACKCCVGTEAEAQAEETVKHFVKRLPELRRILATDVKAAYEGDPAAGSYAEIISCYPVIKALVNYRVAHELLLLHVPLIPRIITEMAHSETGIDIHPAAQIGEYFTIDHGTGVVIGATCIIGNHVKLYQGVTLGARSFPLDEEGKPIKGIPRHPILEDRVIVYSNATILGRITIGAGTVIGGNLWVTQSTKPGERLVQAKKRAEQAPTHSPLPHSKNAEQ